MDLEQLEKDDIKFNKLYKQIYSECYKELADSLKPFKRKIFLLFICLLILDLLLLESSPQVVPLSILILIVAILAMYKKNTKTYRHLYKTKVVASFIKLYNKNLNYSPEKAISSKHYQEAEFEKFDTFNSEDLIYGKLDNHEIEMSQIYTEKILLNPNDSRQYIPLFCGFFAISTFDNMFDGTIKIRTDKGKLLNAFRRQNKLDMDSQEFEKYFDVISTNKLQTMQVLTSDIMNKLINFEQTHHMRIELTIKKQKIFIRFHSKTFLNPPLFSVMDYKTLLRDYNLTNFIFDISRDLIKATAETKI